MSRKTIFIFGISLTALSVKQRRTHHVAIKSVHDINTEVWKIMEGKTLIADLYFILAHSHPRYKKILVQGVLLNNY